MGLSEGGQQAQQTIMHVPRDDALLHHVPLVPNYRTHHGG